MLGADDRPRRISTVGDVLSPFVMFILQVCNSWLLLALSCDVPVYAVEC